MKRFLLLSTFIALGMVAFVAPAYSDTLTFNYNYEFSGGTAPVGPTPWLTATFQDVSGGVELTLGAAGLTGSELVTEWDFNYITGENPADNIGIGGISGNAIDSVNLWIDNYKADGDGLYDIEFRFPTAETGDRFVSGDTFTILFTGTDVDVGDFNYLSTPAGGHGPFYSAAHVQGIGANGADSGWVAPVGVPEPTVILLLGLGLIGLAQAGRLVKKQ